MLPSLVMALILVLCLPLFVDAQTNPIPPTSAILLRANLGYDPIGGGFAFGAGGGYRFPFSGDYAEVLADVYYGPGQSTWTSGSWNYDYTYTLLFLAVRANWLFFYKPGSPGIYALVGTGLFAGSYSWKQVQTYPLVPPVTSTLTSNDQYFASGTILNLGAAFSTAMGLEVRAEIPVMVFFGAYGNAAAVSIPITVSVIYRL
jgi:hypothetical protein